LAARHQRAMPQFLQQRRPEINQNDDGDGDGDGDGDDDDDGYGDGDDDDDDRPTPSTSCKHKCSNQISLFAVSSPLVCR